MTARTWVIDAANVVGSRPDGWWRDRPGAAARLHARILRLLTYVEPPAEAPVGLATEPPARPAGDAEPGSPPGPPERVVLVLEGAARAGVEPGTVLAVTRSGLAENADRPPDSARSLTVVHAPGSGDDAIVAAALAATPPVLVFTSDRALRSRVTANGAQAHGAGSLWALLDRV
ncbi:hypothetical protein [Pseudofrankia inefficax]|uniref:NYN domain-containing protein n=1 Tax=Pseudofrankia inefficax (strain DSM 45817 / CECT 9037 / DDB 130130 / EuI1c) TaxID=298654 RepID=E3J163_PSEI1|nr:hypothetical protein [Pseudofrankia inefficax]ADP79241.1 hypothetical protein FraEuI1c_1169 [Pseudofrankia inefficax]